MTFAWMVALTDKQDRRKLLAPYNTALANLVSEAKIQTAKHKNVDYYYVGRS